MEAPFQKFADWFKLAQESGEEEPTAMGLASVDLDGKPSLRTVLMKAFDERGFVFYTNETSRKGRDLLHNNYAALCFYWPKIEKQVRIEGRVEKTSDKEADQYFASRPRVSQLGAWASKQSASMNEMQELKQRFAKYEKKFGNGPIPRPPFWCGYRVEARSIEFWSKGEFRLHDRELYTKKNAEWKHTLLYP